MTPPAPHPLRKLLLLAVLYFVQGLPYGFQIIALPVYLRAEGASLQSIGMASALSLPWMLKFFWGPAVDRYGSERFGRRRSWIVPLQVLLMLVCLLTGFLEPSSTLVMLALLVLAMNVAASTMDVAVDGLAIDLLRPEELGYGNISQVVGYKLGILTGGGLLVWASDRIGWQGLFFAMAALVGLALAVTLPYRELPWSARKTADTATLSGVVKALGSSLKLPGMVWLLLFIGTYKLGESMADAMFKPFLFDVGYTPQEVGVWIGIWGTIFSLAGSFLGGLMASRVGIVRTLTLAATLRALAVGGEWWLSLVEPTQARVIGVIAAEQAFGGMLTPVVFALMMSRTDRRIGASHYTLLATVEVAGKIGASTVSGFVAGRLGYSFTFALATALAVAFLALLVPLSRTQERSQEALDALADRPL